MFITIHSSNEYLYDILQKNPFTDNGLYAKNIRGGTAIGATIPKGYAIVFRSNDNSYGESSLGLEGMISPEVYLNISKEFFQFKERITWLDKTTTEIDIEPVTLQISNILIDSNWFKEDKFLLSKYLDIKCYKTGFNTFRLEFNTNSIVEAVELSTFIVFLIALSNRQSLYLEDNVIEKYTKKMLKLQLPYFIYYLFLKRIKSPKIFEKIKPKLESHYKSYTGDTVNFTNRSTQEDRIAQVKSLIDNEVVLDFGCGEHSYFKALASKVTKYYSYDAEDFSKLYQTIKARYNKDWVYLSPDWIDNSDVISEETTLLMTEVIEHINVDELKGLIQKIQNKVNVKRVIITTPNRDFNQYYMIDKRREDHLYELNEVEFKQLLSELFPNSIFRVENVGDSINNISVTLLADIWITN